MHIRKNHIEAGKIYFWTATLNKWQTLMHNDNYKKVIIDSLQFLSKKKIIDVFAFVIMPNHLHFIWRMNKLNGKEAAHASFLKYTAHTFKKMLILENNKSISGYKVIAANKQYEFWQRDSLAVELYSPNVAFQKLNYIHYNPCNAYWNLAIDPCDYTYSSAKFYEEGIKEFSFIKDLREEF